MTAITALEFDRVRRDVASRAAMEEAAEILGEQQPYVDPDRLAEDQSILTWLLRRVEEGAALPSGAVPEVSGILQALRREGAVVEAPALRDLRALLEYAREVLVFFRPGGESDPSANGRGGSGGDSTAGSAPPPAAGALLAGATVPTDLLRDLTRMILPEGAVNEEAIPEIARLRGEIRRLNQGLIESADQMIRQDRHMYQADRPTIRDGRTVVPLAANFRGRVDGIVHEASGSGETIYVEPRELVNLNNDLVHARNAVLQEVRRVLRELSRRVRELLPEIEPLHRALLGADLLLARVRYAAEHGGRILPRGDRLVLRSARHPLLGAACVPLDIAYDPEIRLMIISGPNTGGKTVLLKTVGLLSMMNQSAIPVPAAPESTIPWFDHWGVDIGDEQSLDEALSTFSGHLRSIADLCRSAGPRSLILLDELGSGTDPDEGAALSMAVVDHLIEQGSTVLVTTHQTVLKHYGYTREGAQNASMAFDEETHRPTYRVITGRPGSSHALDTARAQGLPGEILTRAAEYLADRGSSVAEIIARLGDLEDELRTSRAALQAEEARVLRRDEELRRREEALLERETVLRREGLVELDRLVREARSRVEGEVRRLRERGGALDGEEIRRAQEEIRRIEAAQEREHALVREREEQRSAEAGPINPGAEVTHRRTERAGRVRSVRGDRAEVQFGAIRMTVPLRELLRTGDDTPSAGGAAPGGATGKDSRPQSPPATPRVTSRPHLTSVFELDLRGRRLQEALDELERQVDAAILNDLSSFSIIHGTGTGVLQKGVRDYLEGRPEVARYAFAPPEEGGFGKTIVQLA
jgi:DNA mismatch repair protein MutS2